ncbi:MAG: RNA pseudouridine synthase [Bacteroidia bacterium]|nr:MAG: RNA pseudouridine synthase [Bacteroidia bacterium]
MQNPEGLEDRILYEDNHLIIINKRSSEIVQGDKTGDTPLSELVKDYIKIQYNKPGNVFLGVVHRIDRPVSGAVIFARTSKALSRLNNMLREGTIKKKYLAVVQNPPPSNEGKLTHHLKKNEKQNKSYVCLKDTDGAKQAELNYKLLAESKSYYLLEVELLTGRHHQIRAQLSATGCPIKGDLKYGFSRSNKDGSIHLHAYLLDFLHPVSNKQITVQAAAPDHDPVWQAFKEHLN